MSASQTPGGAPEIMSEAGPFQGLSQLCLSPPLGGAVNAPEPSQQGATGPPHPQPHLPQLPGRDLAQRSSREMRPETPAQVPCPFSGGLPVPPAPVLWLWVSGSWARGQAGSRRWPERRGSTASAESTGREVERPEGRVSGSRGGTTGTDLSQWP